MDNTKIAIFPSSNRSVNSKHYGDNFATEANLSSIIYNLLRQSNSNITSNDDKVKYSNGFVINDSYSKDGDFKFNLLGYYVVVKGGLRSTSGVNSGEIYASLTINAEDDDPAYNYINGVDDNTSNFFIRFINDIPSPIPSNTYYLHLLTTGNSIPNKSKLKLINQAALSVDNTFTGKNTFSGSTIVNTPTENSQAANKSYVDNKINSLDVGNVGSDGGYIQKISETDGKISATRKGFDTSISSSSTNNNAPTSKAVYTEVNEAIKSLMNTASDSGITFTYTEDTSTGKITITGVTIDDGEL